MATLVKEKRKEKNKRPKEIKNIPSTSAHELEASEDQEILVKFETSEINEESLVSETSVHILTDKTDEENKIEVLDPQTFTPVADLTNNAVKNTAYTEVKQGQEEKPIETIIKETSQADQVLINKTISDEKKTQPEEKSVSFQKLNTKLDIINMQYKPTLITGTENKEKESVSTVDSISNSTPQTKETNSNIEDTQPTAPVFDFEESIPQVIQQQAVQEPDLSPKLKSMPLEEALRLYGGMTLMEVRAMSEREELNVESGPDCGPEHPLVDLLLTFRQSLASLERERIKIAETYTETERYRETLWKIEKRPIIASEKCVCGATVEFRGTYEFAELMKNRLPIAKMKLKGLLNDAQDCYCHHQHAALLAHYQIEEFIALTSQSSKKEIRTALSLLLQELRVSGSEADVLNGSLQRWARELAASLVDARDMRQLLFLLHHLFRQTRSVHWAAPFISLPANDSVDVARILATVELILCGKTIDTATECTEGLESSSEVWEEVDKRGTCAAVSDGALRERDLMGLITALPLQEVVRKLALFRGRDTQTRDEMWIDKTGGYGVIKVICGARWLIAVLVRGLSRHPHYSGLATHLGGLADLTVQTLADLHLHNSPHYKLQLLPQITAELEELFSSSFALVSRNGLSHTRLPYRMLTDRAAMAYCMGFMIGLHDSIDKPIDGVDATIPGELSCGQRVKVLSQMAVDRHNDHDLARNIVEFIFQIGIKRKTTPCKGDCESTARQCLADVLRIHTYMYPTALYIMADFYEADNTDVSSLKYLEMELWRPVPQELLAVLADWKKRCPKLLPHLLLGLDYSPKGGISLQSQETLLWWLSEECTSGVGEWRWEVTLKSWTHRVWRGEGGTLTPVQDDHLYSHMYNLLVTDYGHSVPMICEVGVKSLIALCAAGRVKETIHCLNPMLISLAQSPESISFTPKFKELVSLLIASGPTLVQRALGRGRDSGTELLHRLLISHLAGKQMFCDVTPSAVCAAWLHLLCASETATLAETAVCATRDWTCLDHFVRFIMQDTASQARLKSLLASSSRCPTVVEAILRARSYEQRDLVARLGDILYRQRLNKERIHVDNGLQAIGADISSEELVIHQCAAAALVAPVTSPSHLTLWRTFMHLYLQRPQCDMRESSHPLGPLYFSGIIKSRVLTQLKKRLAETAAHHRNEAEQLKHAIKAIQKPKTETTNRVKPMGERDREFIPKLSLIELTGDGEEEGSDREEGEGEGQGSREGEGRDMVHMLCYHEAAEKLVKTYLGWLEQGDTILAMHHQADITRFIPQQAMEVAWQRCLDKCTPSTPDDELSPRISRIQSHVPQTPLQRAVDRITRYKPGRKRKSRHRSIMSPIDEIKSTDKRSLLILLDKRLKELEALAEEWERELSRVCVLDEYVCDLVRGLRAPVPLKPIRKACSNNCRPITIHLQVQEWCVDTRTENAIKENRASALSALRKLIRPRPHIAETAAAIQTIARHVQDGDTACSVLERAWRTANAPNVDNCPSVKDALQTLFTNLAQRWISSSGIYSSQLLSKFCSLGVSSRSFRNELVAALVSPAAVPWCPLYTAILDGQLPPDAAFSFLSKFEMSRLSDTISTSERKDLFDKLLIVLQTYNSRTEPEYQVLNELLSVHMSNVIDASFFPYVCSKCCNAAVACTIPPALFTHLHSALNRCIGQVGFNELGHSLRNIGEVWWSVRSTRQSDKEYSEYSPHIAVVIATAARGLANAAHHLSYSEERVSWCTWGALIEAVSPWTSPRAPLPPLLAPSSPLLGQVVRVIGNELRYLINHGGLKSLLQHIWEYCVQQICTVDRPNSECSDQDRTQVYSVLAEFTDLPWELDWFTVKCMPGLVQLCNISSSSVRQWCMVCVRSVTPEQWMCGMTSLHLVQHLATLLYVSTTLPLFQQSINSICMLPWYELPMSVLEPTLERFYGEHYSTTLPYHTLPQFRIILYASELQWEPSTNDTAIYLRAGASEKRICSVSFWIRVTSAPALQGHVANSINMLLDIVTELAVHLDPESVELDSLLGRAISILYTEPAAAASLPVWLKFVSTSTALVLRSCISAIARFTSIEYFGTLSDEIIKAYMRHSEPTSWRAIYSRWRDCLWSSSKEFCKRGRLHTAYGVIDRSSDVREAINVLAAMENFDFVENEVITAVWICVTCQYKEVGVLTLWGEEPKRNLLRAITLHSNRDRPTAKLRLLCRFALCVLSPNSEPAQRSYEAACTAVLGSNPGDVLTWAKQPSMKRLVELAIKLFPKHDNYFEMEMEKV